MSGDAPNQVAIQTLAALDAALTAQDATAVAKCFFPLQALWRDVLALTCHIRTFAGAADDVASSLVETTKLRGFNAGLKLSGTAQFIPATPALVSIYLFGVDGRRPKQPTDKIFTYSAIHRLRLYFPNKFSGCRMSRPDQAPACQEPTRQWNRGGELENLDHEHYLGRSRYTSRE